MVRFPLSACTIALPHSHGQNLSARSAGVTEIGLFLNGSPPLSARSAGVTEIGLVGSVGAAAEGLASPFMGRLADRYGRRPIFIISMAGGMVASVVLGLANTYYLLLFTRVVQGTCGSTAGLAAAYIADVTTEEERPDYMTKFMAALNLGVSMGPAFGGFLNEAFGYRWACFAAAGVCALNLACLLLFLPDSRAYRDPEVIKREEEAAAAPERGSKDPEPAEAPPRLNCAAWSLCFAGFLTFIPFTAFEALAVVFLQEDFFGGSECGSGDGDLRALSEAGSVNLAECGSVAECCRADALSAAQLHWAIVISCAGVVGFLVNIFFYAPIQRCIGLKGAILLGGACSAVGFVAIGVVRHQWLFLSWALLLVFGENMMGTSVQVLLTMVVDQSMFGEAMGWFNLSSNLARSLGPFGHAPLYEHVSHSLPWELDAVIKACATGIALSAKATKSEDSPPEGDTSDGEMKPSRPSVSRTVTSYFGGDKPSPAGSTRVSIRASAATTLVHVKTTDVQLGPSMSSSRASQVKVQV